jgi:hypothetical protein
MKNFVNEYYSVERFNNACIQETNRTTTEQITMAKIGSIK